jgi:hypothetical protein
MLVNKAKGRIKLAYECNNNGQTHRSHRCTSFVQGDQKLSVHLIITGQKTRKSILTLRLPNLFLNFSTSYM